NKIGGNMKIAITASGDNLDSQLDPRFGRCQNFVIIDPNTMDFEAMPNESAMASGGAGIQAAQTIVNIGIDTLITGNVGPNAYEILSAAGIETMTGASGTVRQALEQYNSGSLQSAAGATVGAHAGMGGRGKGMEHVAGVSTKDVPGKSSTTKEQEISILEKELKQTELQLAQMKKKLDVLKK
ncbi:MAG: NifB/NifX family molybdenum-iron cluster-binding protein, partial [ANME-2 cluster archaeon]|nr:NifB/NifX family molybdenum-iron cluster-binding protein [ANME-2 cluster archaeon]